MVGVRFVEYGRVIERAVGRRSGMSCHEWGRSRPVLLCGHDNRVDCQLSMVQQQERDLRLMHTSWHHALRKAPIASNLTSLPSDVSGPLHTTQRRYVLLLVVAGPVLLLMLI